MAGICPLVRCPKGLLNGPCGGTNAGGKCELDPTRDCAWVMIYRSLEKLSQLSELEEIVEPHDWSKQVGPRILEVEPIDLMEKLKETKKVIEHLGV
jgi:hypothetical protein